MERGAFNVKIPRQSVKFVGPWLVGTEMAYTTTHTHTRTDVFKLVVQIEVRSFAMGTKFVQSLSATYKGEKKTHVDQFS